MLTQQERAEWRTHYINRFRNRSFDGTLEIDQTETKEYQQIDRRIRKLENELQDARQELYELNQAFDTISREETVRKSKAQFGVRPEIDALLGEVYQRCQQATKLMGSDYSYRHELPNAYAYVRNWVVNGTFGTGRYSAHDGDYEYHPLHIEYQLLVDAGRIMYHDNTKKGAPLCERVQSARMKAWERYADADHPVTKEKAS